MAEPSRYQTGKLVRMETKATVKRSASMKSMAKTQAVGAASTKTREASTDEATSDMSPPCPKPTPSATTTRTVGNTNAAAPPAGRRSPLLWE